MWKEAMNCIMPVTGSTEMAGNNPLCTKIRTSKKHTVPPETYVRRSSSGSRHRRKREGMQKYTHEETGKGSVAKYMTLQRDMRSKVRFD